MSRRIYLILLPVLALILSVINCSADISVPSLKPVAGYSFSGVNQVDHRVSIIFGKDANHKHKNAIRIKAWDESGAIILSPVWFPVSHIFYFSRPNYWSYSSPTISHRFSRHQLRGPPSA